MALITIVSTNSSKPTIPFKPVLKFVQDENEVMNIEVTVPSGSRNGSPSLSSSGSSDESVLYQVFKNSRFLNLILTEISYLSLTIVKIILSLLVVLNKVLSNSES